MKSWPALLTLTTFFSLWPVFNHLGLIAYVWSFDTYYISSATYLGTLFLSAIAFANNRPSWALMGGDLAQRMGLFGTIVGFTMMFPALAANSDTDKLAAGMIALHTTGVGLVCATYLWLLSLAMGAEGDTRE